MLNGFFPFVAARPSNALLKKVQNAQDVGESLTLAVLAQYQMSENAKRLPKELIVLMDSLLTIDASKRPSIRAALDLALAWLDTETDARDAATSVRAALSDRRELPRVREVRRARRTLGGGAGR